MTHHLPVARRVAATQGIVQTVHPAGLSHIFKGIIAVENNNTSVLCGNSDTSEFTYTRIRFPPGIIPAIISPRS